MISPCTWFYTRISTRISRHRHHQKTTTPKTCSKTPANYILQTGACNLCCSLRLAIHCSSGCSHKGYHQTSSLNNSNQKKNANIITHKKRTKHLLNVLRVVAAARPAQKMMRAPAQ